VKRVSFVKLSELSEVPVGKMKMFRVGEKEYLVANVNGNYYAIGNRCTHASADLSRGSLEGNVVTCPKHKSKFDVTTGKVISRPKMLFIHPKINDELSYEVKVEGNALLLKIE
jgi:3-phenylpropionate/trans-cinnamate dioxygenase ferredoxin subunit